MAGDQMAAVFEPARRLSADSNRSPACATRASAMPRPAPSRNPHRNPAPSGRRRYRPPAMPPTRPAQVLLGLILGASRGPPIGRPAKIGEDVGRPDHEQQPDDMGEPARRVVAQPDQGQGRQADIDHAAGRPDRARAPGSSAATSRAPGASRRRIAARRDGPAGPSSRIEAAARSAPRPPPLACAARRRPGSSRLHSPAMTRRGQHDQDGEQPAAHRGDHEGARRPAPGPKRPAARAAGSNASACRSAIAAVAAIDTRCMRIEEVLARRNRASSPGRRRARCRRAATAGSC